MQPSQCVRIGRCFVRFGLRGWDAARRLIIMSLDSAACNRLATLRVAVAILGFSWLSGWTAQVLCGNEPKQIFTQYCFDCHEGTSAEGNLDLSALLAQDAFDATLIFENIATGKMPPAAADVPSDQQRLEMLSWLAEMQFESKPSPFRRISRHEFVHSVNDLLGTNLDMAAKIPEDRGTRNFDSDRRIQLSRQMLGSYFSVADQMLEHALPSDGFVGEKTWITNKLKDSHESYNIYVSDYRDGLLFSWTRANNGNSYSFFYDNFDPPAAGWYELTFDVAKVGDLEGHVSIQVHAGKYYYADDRPQPQRLLDVVSVGNSELESKAIRVFLTPGENVSVHCYSKNNFRDKNPKKGAYLRHMKARGPLQDAWPPSRYRMLFGDLSISSDPKIAGHRSESDPPAATALPLTNGLGYQSNLQRIGGSIRASSFQTGMEKEKMQDGSNRTFWHTRFKPTLAKPPHFVILENPNAHAIEGLSYATWSGGNGNGQIEKFEVYLSDDGENWGEPMVAGDLETRLANEQPIPFPNPTTSRFIKFLATQSFSLDGRSLASIGKLDIVASLDQRLRKTKVSIASNHANDLQQVIRRFAERAFSSELTDEELQPYYDVARTALKGHGDFVEAAKSGFKAVICSPRFLIAPGEHSSEAHSQNASLARALWLSVPNANLQNSTASLRDKIAEMLADERSNRMIKSLCDQWLNLRSWNNVAPSLKLYPRYDDLLDHYLPLETNAYLAHLIRENRPVGELIDSDYSFLNQRLADHYDIEGVKGQQLRRVSFGPDVPRGGLLTMGSVLKVTTDGFDTSPILRGAWISRNLVGTPVSPPPESVKAIEPEHGKEAASLREQIELHKNHEACYACHKSIDPYGFALENFDSTGQWRTKYSVEMPHKNTFQFRLNGYSRSTTNVDAAGKIDDQEFTDIHGLKKILLNDEQKIAYNLAKKFFEYANGFEPNLNQRLALLTIVGSGNCRMRDLVENVLVYSLRRD